MSDQTLLPPNSSLLERSVATLCQRITAIPVPYIALYSITDCPLQFLPWLAWDKRVEFWSAEWSETQKRAAIAGAKVFNQQRGTRASIQTGLDQFQPGWTLTAWYELAPKGAPYTFILSNPTSPRITLDDLQLLSTNVDATKSARDLYIVEATVVSDSTLYIRGAAQFDEYLTIATQDA